MTDEQHDPHSRDEKRWLAESKALLDQSLDDIQQSELEQLRLSRQFALAHAHPLYKSRKALTGFATAACLAVIIAMPVLKKVTAPGNVIALNGQDFEVMLENMDMLTDMDMLAALGELDGDI